MNLHVPVFTIGTLAKAAGVTTPTIRYYEEIGLLPPAPRTAGGQRSYDADDLGRLTFIKQCRDFGFGIDQVRVLLDLSISTNRDCIETRDIAQVHLDQVREKLDEIRLLERRLESFVTRCNNACAGGPSQDCVIFKDLATRVKAAGGCCG
ncbi:MerR family transcriptional regulator [Mesorhizobium sp. 43Arga]